ncbi:MAG: archaetidylserine decarboxylase [Methylococcaceae bacterium]|nr:archaetidylserine decarboxylase [Methylococcaceae bacterium]MDZ4155807.1 archaetidylserine decarboxylase [Methylococcales bacterium]MDP2391844.1 archaetidylserine decarboxylase [Methylococcaceae bacterium]MDP3018917.1 archaetidylserine decarboxylase [Methylococcaceae bacterium]MDP3391478.1 archaetidylserine decarboxylase [Methylococcaceae bacterium]
MTIKDTLTTLPQYLLPHHAMSGLMSKLTHCENKTWKNLFIREIIKHYGVNMDEALQPDINAYKSFNHFFTRELKPGVRPLVDEQGAIASPADGVVSQAGNITDGNIFQAKGKSFTAIDLLGGSAERAEPFNNGVFSTIYLSPKDYHRLHMPLTGTLREMVHVPGRLFSVNTATTRSVPGLFARNERVVAIFDTEAGPMALVLVGAIFVASVETVWHGVVTPPTVSTVKTWQYQDNAPILQKGEEMGRFNMGSTIIVLFGKDAVQWAEDFSAEKPVKLGEKVGQVRG